MNTNNSSLFDNILTLLILNLVEIYLITYLSNDLEGKLLHRINLSPPGLPLRLLPLLLNLLWTQFGPLNSDFEMKRMIFLRTSKYNYYCNNFQPYLPKYSIDGYKLKGSKIKAQINKIQYLSKESDILLLVTL